MSIALLIAASIAEIVGGVATVERLSWVTADDYPAASLAAREEGTVFFELDVDPTGRVENCNVNKSSGYKRLDEITCRLVTRRGRFPPEGPPGLERASWRLGFVIWKLPQAR